MGQRQQSTESERAQDPSEAHLNPEEIGKFTNGELTSADNRRAQKHLANCDRCRRDLIALIRLAAETVTEEECKLLQSLPAFESYEQVRQLTSRLPHVSEEDSKGLAGAAGWWERLQALLPAPIFTPAFAAAVSVFLALGSWGGYQWYARHQINNDLAYGYDALQRNWPVSAEDFRPPGEFAPSPFSMAHGPAPATDPAAQAFEKVLARDEENRKAVLGLALFQSFSGRMAQADSLLQILLHRDSSDAEAWNQRGIVRARLEQYEPALAAFAAALRHQPQNHAAAFNRALLLSRLRRSDEAIKAWQDYLRRDPASPWSAAAREHLRKLE
jgi:tetratricopeptide (TPR) repeat protein